MHCSPLETDPSSHAPSTRSPAPAPRGGGGAASLWRSNAATWEPECESRDGCSLQNRQWPPAKCVPEDLGRTAPSWLILAFWGHLLVEEAAEVLALVPFSPAVKQKHQSWEGQSCSSTGHQRGYYFVVLVETTHTHTNTNTHKRHMHMCLLLD